MYKKIDVWEDPDEESEDDIMEEELKVGAKVDFEDIHTHEWCSGTVVCNLGNIIKVVKDEEDEMDVDGRQRNVEEHWFNKDVSELAPYQTKSRSPRAGILSIYNRAFHM